MFYMHPEFERRIDAIRRREAIQQAATWRLCQAGKSWTGQMPRTLCRTLSHLGRLLIRLGRHLESYSGLPAGT